MDATALLRPGLLDGRVIALGGGEGAERLSAPLRLLGAATAALPATLDEEAMTAAVDPRTDVLLHDLRPAFASGGHAALRSALDLAWVSVRAVANAAFIAGGRGGKVTLLAPAPARGDTPDPAVAGVRAAAENLARTLSIEWARHGIVTVAITPGADADDAQLAALAAYLASPAGDYFSGCRLALGEVAAPAA
jgi:NAD(P)-dependent dehydrogenase (short-subunit alcohol dehydrogenase family)